MRSIAVDEPLVEQKTFNPGSIHDDTVVIVMEIARSVKCKELKKVDVVDSSGRKVGHIGDLTFRFDGKLKLSQFILAGPAWEEFLESIKVRPDRDPVFDAALIKKMGDKVYLDTTANSLKTTLDKGAIGTGEVRFSGLEKMDIVDKDGVKVGRTVDVHFEKDGSCSLIVGGGFIEEKLEAAGIKEDVDILVPGTVISAIDDRVRLLVSKATLGTTMDDVLKKRKPETKKAKDSRTVQRDVSKVQLFSQRPF